MIQIKMLLLCIFSFNKTTTTILNLLKFSVKLILFYFSCHQRPIIYQFMKIWASGVQLLLIAE